LFMDELEIHFKTNRQSEEFPLVSPHLRGLVLDVAFYVGRKYGKPILITDLLRTQEEQDAIYGSNPEYWKKPWRSVHEFGRGCDIRSRDFMAAQTAELLRYIASAWPYDPERPEMHTAIIHSAGNGMHLHLQVLS